MLPRPRRPLYYTLLKSLRSRPLSGRSEVAERPRLDRPEPRLQGARDDHAVRAVGSRYRKDYRDAFDAPPRRRGSRLHEQRHGGFSKPPASHRNGPFLLVNLAIFVRNYCRRRWARLSPQTSLSAMRGSGFYSEACSEKGTGGTLGSGKGHNVLRSLIRSERLCLVRPV